MSVMRIGLQQQISLAMADDEPACRSLAQRMIDDYNEDTGASITEYDWQIAQPVELSGEAIGFTLPDGTPIPPTAGVVVTFTP